VNRLPMFFQHEELYAPTLKALQEHDLLKRVVVDMGAIKFVVSGADIMRPGITRIDPGIGKGDFVVIVDETHGKPLAVGIAAYSSEEMQASDSGKVIQNIHYVGDHIWSL